MKLLHLALLLVLLAGGCLGEEPPGAPSPDGEGPPESLPDEEADGAPGLPTPEPSPTETPAPTEKSTPSVNATSTGTPARLRLSLPFAPEDDPHGLLPMGETISHDGEPHVGIDFFWDHEVNVTASAPGEVVYVEQRETGHVGTWDVFVRTGEYVVGYTEMGSVNPDLGVGDRVERGERLGTNWNAISEDEHWMIHWEFGYYPSGWQEYDTGNRVPHPKRLCPMSFFTEESRNRIQGVWDNTTWTRDGVDYKERFPYVCSGVFHGKDE